MCTIVSVNNRWKTGRLEAFSDGVFAIAITLLVLEIDIPDSGFDNLWAGVLSQWPSYLAYVTSFLTIGVTWLHHHLIFRRTAWLDSMVMRLNLLLLMLVAFLPFPTMLMARGLDKTTDAERVAVVFYGIVLLVIAVTMFAIWHQATRRQLLEPNVTDAEVRAVTRLTLPIVGYNVAVVVVALFAPKAAVFGYLLIALVALFRQHGEIYEPSESGD